MEKLVDMAQIQAFPPSDYVAPTCVIGRRDGVAGERVITPDRADIAICEQGLGSNLGPDRRIDDTGFQVDDTVAQSLTVFIQLAHEPQLNERRFLAHSLDYRRAEAFRDPVTGAQGESSPQRQQIKAIGRAQQGMRVFNEKADLVAHFRSARCGH